MNIKIKSYCTTNICTTVKQNIFSLIWPPWGVGFIILFFSLPPGGNKDDFASLLGSSWISIFIYNQSLSANVALSL